MFDVGARKDQWSKFGRVRCCFECPFYMKKINLASDRRVSFTNRVACRHQCERLALLRELALAGTRENTPNFKQKHVPVTLVEVMANRIKQAGEERRTH